MRIEEEITYTFTYYSKMSEVALALAKAGRYITITTNDDGQYELKTYVLKRGR